MSANPPPRRRDQIRNVIRGKQGPPGPRGPQGVEGPPGADGVDGVDGKDGEKGEKGRDGRDGKDGQLIVLPVRPLGPGWRRRLGRGEVRENGLNTPALGVALPAPKILGSQYDEPASSEEGRDKPRDSPMNPRQLQKRDHQLVYWIESAQDPPSQEPCLIPPCVLTIHDIENRRQGDDFLEDERSKKRTVYDEHSYDLNLKALEQPPDERRFVGWRIGFNQDIYQNLGITDIPSDVFYGMTAPGVIVLEVISRAPDLEIILKQNPSLFPPISEIALALYTSEHGNVDFLKHIFFCDISLNVQTWDLLGKFCKAGETKDFEHSTHEYYQILGSRLGRVAGYIMLGAFPRGTHCIERVHYFYSGSPDAAPCLRFDIGTLPQESQSSCRVPAPDVKEARRRLREQISWEISPEEAGNKQQRCESSN